MKKKQLIHGYFAPSEGRWTPWVKPVLFAHLDEKHTPQPLPPAPDWIVSELLTPLFDAQRRDVANPYRHTERLHEVALVVDLPGRMGAHMGAWLVEHGFRPIPLYNAIPDPHGVIELGSLMNALVDMAEELQKLPDDAPPAFLLDARRLGLEWSSVIVDRFDNRSRCFSSDFPSADTLWEAGIRRVVLIQERGTEASTDLAPTLFSFRDRGIELWLAQSTKAKPVEQDGITRPPLVKRIARSVEAFFFFGHREDGSFGRFVRSSGSSG